MPIGSSKPASETLLPNLIDEIAQSDPDAIWGECPVSAVSYDFGFREITYAKLANAINGVAHCLEKFLGRSSTSQTLAYLAPNDPRCAITFVAAMKVGHKLFLTSDRNSVPAHLSLFDDLECTTIVTTRPHIPAIDAILTTRSMNLIYIRTLDHLLSASYAHYPYSKAFHATQSDIAFACHTSGSTGFPKPRLYTHEFIARAARNIGLKSPRGFQTLMAMTGNSRNVLLLPLSHPAGIHFGILNAVFNRTTVVLPLPSVPPTGETLVEILKRTKADWAATAPLTLETVSKDFKLLDTIAANLHFLIYSGGSLPKIFGDIIAKSIKLTSLLGSSEFGPFPTIYPDGFDFELDWNYLQIHPAVGAKFRQETADTFELVIERSPDTEPHQAVFTLFPELQEYRTSDIFSPHPSWPDMWTHAARSDDVIVFLNGEKINPIAYESLISKDNTVSAALLFGSQRFEAGLLIELVEQKPLSTTERAIVIEHLWPTIKYANSLSPAFARVSKSHVCFTDPGAPVLRTGKGTIQRQATLNLYGPKIESLYADAETVWTVCAANAAYRADDAASIRRCICDGFSNIAQWNDVGQEADFFIQGIDSLQVLRLVRHMRAELGIQSIEPSTIYLNTSIKSLVKAVQALARDFHESEIDKLIVRKEDIAKIIQRFSEDIDNLAVSVSGITSPLEREAAPSEGHVVMLTGSTGSIGSYILKALLAQPGVSHVYCLNRSGQSEAMHKARNAKLDAALPKAFSRESVTFLRADLSEPESLGLDPSLYEVLQSKVSLIIHNAWPVDFNLPLQSFNNHLAGVVNLVSLSAKSTRLSPILFLSSISAVMNLATSATLSSAVPETMVEDLSAPLSGYGESKYVAERLLSHASEKLRLRIGIARIGQVTGAARSSGRWNLTEWIPSLILSSKYLHAIPSSLSACKENDIDWLPVDILSDALLEIGFGLTAAPAPFAKVYHLLNTKRTSWSFLVPSIVECLESSSASALGMEPIRIVSPSEWLEKLRASAATMDSATDLEATLAVNPALKLIDFYERMIGGDGGAPVSWETAEAEKASQSLRQADAINGDLIKGWVRAWCSR